MTKTFTARDGTTIEVRSDNAWEWRPDTCRCDLVFEMDTGELDFVIHVCELHKAVADGRLIAEVLLHNNTINLSLPNPVSEADENTISTARRAEQVRIEGLGAGETRADSTTKASIEVDLRSKGR